MPRDIRKENQYGLPAPDAYGATGQAVLPWNRRCCQGLQAMPSCLTLLRGLTARITIFASLREPLVLALKLFLR